MPMEVEKMVKTEGGGGLVFRARRCGGFVHCGGGAIGWEKEFGAKVEEIRRGLLEDAWHRGRNVNGGERKTRKERGRCGGAEEEDMVDGRGGGAGGGCKGGRQGWWW